MSSESETTLRRGCWCSSAQCEDGEETGVLGVVVGADAEEFGELGEGVALVVCDDGAEAGGAGVATGAAIAVGVESSLRRRGRRGWGRGTFGSV